MKAIVEMTVTCVHRHGHRRRADEAEKDFALHFAGMSGHSVLARLIPTGRLMKGIVFAVSC